MSRAVVLILILCLCAGCGGSNKAAEGNQTTASETTTATVAAKPEQDAADFLKEVLRESTLGQSGRVWDTLHPFHQAVVSRAKYVDCESSNPSTGTFKKVEVVDQYEEPVRIPGQTKDTPSDAVTFRLTVDVPGFEKPQVVNRTAHAVAVNGQWRWILTPEDYRAFKAHRCPAS